MSNLEVTNESEAVIRVPVDYVSIPLDELGGKIRDLHELATVCANMVHKVALQSLESAWSAGRALIAAKEKVAHGEWTSWRTSNVPGLSEDQACRYMRLAKEIPHVRDLDGLKTVRQAYLACGVIKEPAKKTAPSTVDGLDKKSALAAPDFVSRFQSMRTFLETALPRLEFGKLPPSECSAMESQIHGIIMILKASLEKLEQSRPPKAPASAEVVS
jgi:hypothetical protein